MAPLYSFRMRIGYKAQGFVAHDLQFICVTCKKLQGCAMEQDRSDLEKQRIIDDIRRHLSENGITRKKLSGSPGLSKSAVDHFLAGDFKESTLARINEARETDFGATNQAPSWFGGYTRQEAKKYEGSYITIRPEFSGKNKIEAYVTHIRWANIRDGFKFAGEIQYEPHTFGYGLVFQEERTVEPERAHSGQVWMPPGAYRFFVTTYGEGRVRAAIVSDRDRKGRLKGIQLTQRKLSDGAYLPATCPIAFWRTEYRSDDLGIIEPHHARYEDYQTILLDAEKSILRFSASSL